MTTNQRSPTYDTITAWLIGLTIISIIDFASILILAKFVDIIIGALR